jgi:aspartyl-tRNA(Asn)/glutamyl-tRNA(Gln) amidotransferase subunit B
VEDKGLKQVTDESEIARVIDSVLEAHPNEIEEYRAGKEKLFGFFIGQVMKQTSGKANPKIVNKILKEKLKD